MAAGMHGAEEMDARLRLELANGTVLEDPQGAVLDTALRNLGGRDNGFAILSRDSLFYIQTAVAPEGGFVLEYQEGSLEQHFVAEGVSLDDVIMAFRDYATEGDGWHQRFSWKKLEMK